MSQTKIPLLVVCGPTASGKTGFSLQLAEHFPLEIISADSRQVYRQMDVGTAKATAEEQALVPHYLIDVIDPDEEFSVAQFVDLARPLIEQIHQRGKVPCIVGGTGLYIRALLGGLADTPTGDQELRDRLHRQEDEQPGSLHAELTKIDPVAAERIHPNNIVRTVRALEVYHVSGRTLTELQDEHRFADQPYRVMQFAPQQERAELYQRIDLRAKLMLDAGLVAETRAIIERYSAQLKALQTLGYREVVRYLDVPGSEELMLEEIRTSTRQYAKRQLTWFRKESQIIWVDSLTESGRVLRSIEDFISQQRSGYA
ncbi:tRNA dimethylallyltransferase [Malonomonas rubra DSM 5091]|uniref:tRNA dimethylallyltransferase n=1 Tax=Malonomonas rubra DSM 5091 TaxID=1122189 RepID=A0A1M6DKW4_MALRU|nr:tRNA (adenosine(37)-N6)-dimethylallyltransferase MiaA [Malonomonas rubra]SHI73987.1 tRNA dimethylallyltransferase [Malonomonas rubra DSM 5091]